MLRLACILSLLFAPFLVLAQNHVPNPSFEQYSNCPPDFSYLTNYCTSWSAFSSSTPDYFNNCNSGTVGVPINFIGHQAAADGNAYAGVFSFTDTSTSLPIWKEYIATDIIPLQENVSYDVSMHVSLADSSGYGSDDLGVYFYNSAPFQGTTSLLSITPQVSFSQYGPVLEKSVWKKLEASFIADSAYEHVVIGGFKNLAGISMAPAAGSVLLYPYGSYYYIDLIEIRPSKVRIEPVDTSLCAGDTVSVAYTVPAPGVYVPGNTFKVQLSDVMGSFSSPLDIGSVGATVSGTIKAVVPASLPYGENYRMRIVASSRADTSAANIGSICITPLPQVSAWASSSVCVHDVIYLDGTTDTADQLSWTGPSFSSGRIDTTIVDADMDNAGLYILKALRNECAAYDTTEVKLKPLPVAVANSNEPVCYGDTLRLYAAGGNATRQYEWQGPGFGSQLVNPVIPQVTTDNEGAYILTVIEDGCRSVPDTLLADVRPACDNDSCLFFPDAFTPNKDGVNDAFGPLSICNIFRYELRIYNRWGQQVFYTRDVHEKWDGTLNGVQQDAASFYYFVRYIADNGQQSSFATMIKGNVILVR